MASFSQLPDDIIERILQFTAPDDLLDSILLVSRHLNHLASQRLLWRTSCRHSFKYWHPRHEIKSKFAARASNVDWKALYIERKSQNTTIARLLNNVIKTRFTRLSRMRDICMMGYDAKDYLISQIHVDDDEEDAMARKYFSQSILDSIHRGIAIDIWAGVRDTDGAHGDRQLEQSLAAFDMFVLHDQEGDADEVTRMLDAHAADFRATRPNWDELTTRQKALALNIWLRQQNLTGVKAADFGNLRNSLIGQALRDEAHESNPNISSSIFCSLAARVGVHAECYMAPMMVHVIVFSSPGFDLDGKPSTEGEFMFLDSWGSDGEVPRERLEELTGRFGLTVEGLIGTGSPVGVTERTANNIHVCSVRRLRQGAAGNVAKLLSGHDIVNLHLCLYAVKWARLIFAQPHTMLWNQHFSDILRFTMLHWPEDEWLISKYAATLPPIDAVQPAMGQLETFHREVRTADTMPPSDYQSPIQAGQVAPLKIGQVFRHRRYRWIGVITGFYAVQPPTWEIFDSETEQPEGSDTKGKCYVRSLPSDGLDQPVVAAGNIELITDSSVIREEMFPVAGRFFKRFDKDACQFVSNMDDEYPFL